FHRPSTPKASTLSLTTLFRSECGCTSACMRQMAQGTTPANMMQFRSTQGMAQFVRETPQKIIIMATEVGNIHPLSKAAPGKTVRSEEHTSELQSRFDLVCRLL